MGNFNSTDNNAGTSMGPDPVTAWIADASEGHLGLHPEAGIATQLYSACIQAASLRVRSLRKQRNTSSLGISKLAASLSRLYAWGEDLRAGELDICVTRSSALQTLVLEQLSDLAQALLKGMRSPTPTTCQRSCLVTVSMQC